MANFRFITTTKFPNMQFLGSSNFSTISPRKFASMPETKRHFLLAKDFLSAHGTFEHTIYESEIAVAKSLRALMFHKVTQTDVSVHLSPEESRQILERLIAAEMSESTTENPNDVSYSWFNRIIRAGRLLPQTVAISFLNAAPAFASNGDKIAALTNSPISQTALLGALVGGTIGYLRGLSNRSMRAKGTFGRTAIMGAALGATLGWGINHYLGFGILPQATFFGGMILTSYLTSGVKGLRRFILMLITAALFGSGALIEERTGDRFQYDDKKMEEKLDEVYYDGHNDSIFEVNKRPNTEPGYAVVDHSLPGGPIHTDKQANETLLSTFFNDQDSFHKLMITNLELMEKGEGLPAWQTFSSDGTTLKTKRDGDRFSASDADAEFALALIFAQQLVDQNTWDQKTMTWKAPGETEKKEYTYGEIARYMINRIREKEVEPIKIKNNAGEVVDVLYLLRYSEDKEVPFLDANGAYTFNPSYLSPATYRIFAQIDYEHANLWNKLVDDSYKILEAISQAKDKDGKPWNGRFPDWCEISVIAHDDGTFELKIGPEKDMPDKKYEQTWDAIRVPFRIALDAKWFKDPRAIELCKKIIRSFNMDDLKAHGFYNETFLAMYAAAAVGADDQKAIAELKEALAEFGPWKGVFAPKAKNKEGLELVWNLLTNYKEGRQYGKPENYDTEKTRIWRQQETLLGIMLLNDRLLNLSNPAFAKKMSATAKAAPRDVSQNKGSDSELDQKTKNSGYLARGKEETYHLSKDIWLNIIKIPFSIFNHEKAEQTTMQWREENSRYASVTNRGDIKNDRDINEDNELLKSMLQNNQAEKTEEELVLLNTIKENAKNICGHGFNAECAEMFVKVLIPLAETGSFSKDSQSYRYYLKIMQEAAEGLKIASLESGSQAELIDQLDNIVSSAKTPNPLILHYQGKAYQESYRHDRLIEALRIFQQGLDSKHKDANLYALNILGLAETFAALDRYDIARYLINSTIGDKELTKLSPQLDRELRELEAETELSLGWVKNKATIMSEQRGSLNTRERQLAMFTAATVMQKEAAYSNSIEKYQKSIGWYEKLLESNPEDPTLAYYTITSFIQAVEGAARETDTKDASQKTYYANASVILNKEALLLLYKNRDAQDYENVEEKTRIKDLEEAVKNGTRDPRVKRWVELIASNINTIEGSPNFIGAAAHRNYKLSFHYGLIRSLLEVANNESDLMAIDRDLGDEEAAGAHKANMESKCREILAEVAYQVEVSEAIYRDNMRNLKELEQFKSGQYQEIDGLIVDKPSGLPVQVLNIGHARVLRDYVRNSAFALIKMGQPEDAEALLKMLAKVNAWDEASRDMSDFSKKGLRADVLKIINFMERGSNQASLKAMVPGTDNWITLSEVYTWEGMKDYQKALKYSEKTWQMDPINPRAAVTYAEALFWKQGGWGEETTRTMYGEGIDKGLESLTNFWEQQERDRTPADFELLVRILRALDAGHKKGLTYESEKLSAIENTMKNEPVTGNFTPEFNRMLEWLEKYRFLSPQIYEGVRTILEPDTPVESSKSFKKKQTEIRRDLDKAITAKNEKEDYLTAQTKLESILNQIFRSGSRENLYNETNTAVVELARTYLKQGEKLEKEEKTKEAMDKYLSAIKILEQLLHGKTPQQIGKVEINSSSNISGASQNVDAMSTLAGAYTHKSQYKSAMGICNEALKIISNDEKQNLKAFGVLRVLAWSYSAQGDALKEKDKKKGAENAIPYYKAALLIYQSTGLYTGKAALSADETGKALGMNPTELENFNKALQLGGKLKNNNEFMTADPAVTFGVSKNEIKFIIANLLRYIGEAAEAAEILRNIE